MTRWLDFRGIRAGLNKLRKLAAGHRESAGKRLSAGQPIRVIMLNDAGFFGGAGLALRRQAHSFLMGGHDVAVVCHRNRGAGWPRPFVGRSYSGNMLGVFEIPDAHVEMGLNEHALARRVASAVADLQPDLVIAGNFHVAQWPLSIMTAVRDAGIPIVAYLHDCHWFTGRCIYPGLCTRFETGCDVACPTADEYPPLKRDHISAAWAQRRQVFFGSNRIPLVANSRWMARMLYRASGGQTEAHIIHLGLDETIFVPMERAAARASLGIPDDGVVVVAGAVSLADKWKGGALINEVAQRITEKNVHVICFGEESDTMANTRGFGWIADEAQLSVIYNAADLMLNCVNEEAFGQTLMEAAACGLPLVATEVGGITDIARPGENALLAEVGDADSLTQLCLKLAADKDLRRTLGTNSRRLVEQEFTLAHQYARWKNYICETLN